MVKRILFLLPLVPLLLAGQCTEAFFYGTDEAFVEALQESGGRMTRISPPSFNIETPPPPVPDAQVVMANSKGETVFEGVTNASGVAEGTVMPGRMDHELRVQVTTPDGTELTKEINIPTGWTLVAIKVHKNAGEFVLEWRKPHELRNRDTDSGEHHDRVR